MSVASLPKLKAPPGACDCAIHAYDPATARVPGSTSPAPGWATVEAYRTVQARLGTTRTIVVQPNAYGFDNRATMAAVAALGLSQARAVVTIRPDIALPELSALDAAGAVGVRCHMLAGGHLAWGDLEPIAARIAPLGWHLQLQMDGRLLPEREAMLLRLPCPLVIDHVGKFLEPVPPSHPGVAALVRLLGTGRCWMKLAGPYEVTRTGPPGYEDVGAIARAAVAAAPGRMLWGSNWPHVGAPAGHPPDDAGQLDLLLHWVDDAATRGRILVDNPAALYRFAT